MTRPAVVVQFTDDEAIALLAAFEQWSRVSAAPPSIYAQSGAGKLSVAIADMQAAHTDRVAMAEIKAKIDTKISKKRKGDH